MTPAHLARLALILAALPLSAAAQHFDSATQVLTLPHVRVGADAYGNVGLKLNAVTVLSVGSPTFAETAFDATTGVLSLPSVDIDDGERISHVALQLADVALLTASAASASLSPTRIHVNLVAHNEDTATGGNADCAAFFGAADSRYDANGTALREIASAVAARGASFNLQTDVEYLNLVSAREGLRRNVLRDLVAEHPAAFELDAHAHESNTKNYADVANLLERVAGVRNGIVGGFTAVSCRPDSAPPVWEKFRTSLSPASGIGTPFSATVLTLGASAGHVCDPDASGIWRPRAQDDFFTDDPAQSLPTIGTGFAAADLNEAVTAITRLVTDYRRGRLEPNRLYTASVTIDHCNMDLADSGDTAADVAAFIDAVNALDDGNDVIRWATFSRMLEIWRDEYDSAASLWRGAAD